jgi:hypothetical protein
MKRALSVFVFAVLVVGADVAYADFQFNDGAPSARRRIKPLPRVSITISPTQLIMPMAELSVEVRLAQKFGLMGILGGGTFAGLAAITNQSSLKDLWSLQGGLQARYYLIGDFRHGMTIALEALASYVDGSVAGTSAMGTGMLFSPMLGYKVIAPIGFTFEAQVGYGVGFVMAAVRSGGISQTEAKLHHALSVNVNLGWSF